LKINDSGIGWKSNKTGKSVVLLGKEVDRAEWITLGRQWQLRFFNCAFFILRFVDIFFFFFVLLIYARLTTTKGAIYKFDGFVDTDLEKIKPYIEGPYENELDIVPLATKGWNWGEVDFQGKMLRSHSRFERFDPDLVYN